MKRTCAHHRTSGTSCRPLRAALLAALALLLTLPLAQPALAQKRGGAPLGPNLPVQTVTVSINPLYGHQCVGWFEEFDAVYTTQAAGQPSYAWKVDGAPVAGATSSALTYAFNAAGNHAVECDVTVGGSSGSQTLNWTVTDCGDCSFGPTISANYSPSNPAVGDQVCFNGTFFGFCATSGGYSLIIWDFGDGTTGTGISPCHTYTAPGTYPVTVSVPAAAPPGGQAPSYTIVVQLEPVAPPGGGGGGGGGGGATVSPRSPAPGSGGDQPQMCVGSGGNLSATIALFSGNLWCLFADPVRTRGFPLVNDISINSQWVEGNRPMGRATFTYDIHVGTQTVWSDCTPTTHWALVDGDGTRLDFGPTSAAPAAGRGVFSTLTQAGGGYVLSGAGPPGDLRDAGDFTYYFDSNGKLTQLVDPAGNAQLLTYAAGQLASVLDVNTGKQLTFAWSGGFITEIVQNGGAEVTDIAYQGGAPSSITVKTAGGVALTSAAFTYNADGSVASFGQDGDPSSAVTLGYTAAPSTDCSTTVPMANVAGPAGMATHADWMQPAVPGAIYSVYVTNAQGGKVRYDFDGFGGLIRVVLPPLNGAGQSTTYSFTWTDGQELSSAGDGFATSTFGYASNGTLATAADGLSNAWTWNYGASNPADVTVYQDPMFQQLGVSETLTYGDAAQPHVPTSLTDADNGVWSVTHNAFGQPLTLTPPAGSPSGPVSIAYDEQQGSPTLGYPLTVSDGAGDFATLDAYDALGDVTQVSTYSDPNNPNQTRHTTLFGYDADQRPTFLEHPDGTALQWFYNGRNLAYTLDEANTRYDFTFCSPCGALTGIAGPLGWSLGWAYDSDHNLTTFTDARGKATQYGYGLAGEIKSVTYPDGTSTQVSYDLRGSGLPATITNGRGQSIGLGFDGAERLSFIQPGTDPRISYSYNTDGSLSGYTDAAGATTYAYTPSGQVQSVTYLYTGQPAQELDYTYFPDGSRQSLTWKSGGAQVASWTYGYDLAGRLTSVSNSFGETTGWSYDGEGKLTGQTNQNGTALSIGYLQQRGWPTELLYRAGQSTLADYLVEYDGGIASVGLMTGYTDQASRAQFGFGYDALYRLSAETYANPNQGGQQYAFGYSYDLAGNRTSASVDGNWTYTVDAGNKYTAVYGGNLPPGGGIPAWTWDADGNCTNPMGELAFGWNALSEMTSASVLDPNTGQPTGVAYQFAWDGEGRMVAQMGTGVSARIHVYDGDLLLGELDGTGAPVAAYTWGADGLVSERLLTGTGAPKSLWYVFGPTGDTTYLLDAGGTVVDAYTFDAFGQRRATPNFGTDPNPFGYKGQFGYYTYAPSSAFLLCGARFYYPFWGRWLSRDPIGYDGGPNLYEYCDGDPVTGADPTGLQNCGKKKRDIERIANEILNRFREMKQDVHRLFDPHDPNKRVPGIEGTWAGHQHYYNKLRNDVRKMIDDYKNNGCNKKGGGGGGPLPQFVFDARDKDAPDKPDWYAEAHERTIREIYDVDKPIRDATGDLFLLYMSGRSLGALRRLWTLPIFDKPPFGQPIPVQGH